MLCSPVRGLMMAQTQRVAHAAMTGHWVVRAAGGRPGGVRANEALASLPGVVFSCVCIHSLQPEAAPPRLCVSATLATSDSLYPC